MVGCLLAMVWPNRWRWLTPAVFVNIFLLDLLTKAINGYVNHAQLVPLFVLGVFAVFSDRQYLPLIGFRADDGTPRTRGPSGRQPGGTAETGYASVVWLPGLMLIALYTYIANRLLQGGTELFRGDALLDYIAFNSRYYSAYESTLLV